MTCSQLVLTCRCACSPLNDTYFFIVICNEIASAVWHSFATNAVLIWHGRQYSAITQQHLTGVRSMLVSLT